MSNYWINEDDRNNRYVVHKDSCFRVRDAQLPWEPFENLEEAEQYVKDGIKHYEFHRCRNCFADEIRKEFIEKYRKKAAT